jgi:hypothetical protein
MIFFKSIYKPNTCTYGILKFLTSTTLQENAYLVPHLAATKWEKRPQS